MEQNLKYFCVGLWKRQWRKLLKKRYYSKNSKKSAHNNRRASHQLTDIQERRAQLQLMVGKDVSSLRIH